jgi:hypothetical protein
MESRGFLRADASYQGVYDILDRLVRQVCKEHSYSPPGDPVSHYDKFAIQPLEYIEANKMMFSEGNIIKYVTRWREKDGLQDLLKARDYLQRLIDQES